MVHKLVNIYKLTTL